MKKKKTVKELTNEEDILKQILNEPNWLVEKYRNIWYVIDRKEAKYLCGYIGLPSFMEFNQTTFISAYTDEYTLDTIDVHGGVTFHGNPTHFLCPDNELNWIGFDCNHSNDWSETIYPRDGSVYRTFEYVQKECESVIDIYYKDLEDQCIRIQEKISINIK